MRRKKSLFPINGRVFVFFLALGLWGSTLLAAPDCNDNDFYTNGDTGDDNNPGTSAQPFKTIQKLVDVLGDCIDTDGDTDLKTGYVVGTETPYTEIGRIPGMDYGGITFRKGGNSSSERIILEGIPGPGGTPFRPIIDQQRLSADNGAKVIGIFIVRDSSERASYITIRNFEIRQADIGILTDNDGSSVLPYNNLDIIIEKNHIHHMFGGDNVGAVRLDYCRGCVVQNNVFHDTYNTRSYSTGNLLNDVPHGLHSGVHGYRPENCVIRNNLIFNVEKGVFQKHPDENPVNDGYKVHHNIFYNVTEAAYTPQGNAVLPAISNGSFHHNVVYDSGYAVWSNASGPTAPGQTFLVYNNTIVNSRSIGKIRSLQDVQIYNNIRSGTTQKFGSLAELWTQYDAQAVYELTYMNNNMYFNNSDKWVMNTNSGGVNGGVKDFDRQEWTDGSPASRLPDDRDTASIFDQSPMFTDEVNNDYSLQAGSPALDPNNARPGTTGYLGAVHHINGTTGQYEDENNNIIGPVFADHPELSNLPGLPDLDPDPDPVSAQGVLGQEGGSISLLNNPGFSVQTKVVVPPDALSREETIIITQLKASEIPSTLAYGISEPAMGYRLEPAGLVFKKPVSISLAYRDRDQNGFAENEANNNTAMEESNLRLMYYTGTGWQDMGGTVDAQNNTVSAELQRFSIYALFHTVSTSPEEDSGQNPIKPQRKIFTPGGSQGVNDTIIFGGTAAGATIDIFNLKGQLVRHLENQLFWDGRDDQGNFVKSGMYIYHAKIDGQSISGTLAVAR